jgi:tetraacyldisaccharide 4'-kinase
MLAFCGIARPQRFLDQAREAGLKVVSSLTFPDHYAYPRRALEKIRRAFQEAGAEAAVTTEKDSLKIAGRQTLLEGIPVFYLKIGLEVEPAFWQKVGLLLEMMGQP